MRGCRSYSRSWLAPDCQARRAPNVDEFLGLSGGRTGNALARSARLSEFQQRTRRGGRGGASWASRWPSGGHDVVARRAALDSGAQTGTGAPSAAWATGVGASLMWLPLAGPYPPCATAHSPQPYRRRTMGPPSLADFPLLALCVEPAREPAGPAALAPAAAGVPSGQAGPAGAEPEQAATGGEVPGQSSLLTYCNPLNKRVRWTVPLHNNFLTATEAAGE